MKRLLDPNFIPILSLLKQLNKDYPSRSITFFSEQLKLDRRTILKTIHTIYVNRKMKNAFRANRAKNGELSAQAEESLSGIRVIKAFAREDYQQKKFWKKCLELLQTRKKSYKILAHFARDEF